MASDSGDIARSRAKGDKRARTRASLLEAARELIREKGYERATMEEVAKRAGMTTGAIYGNFKNRDELFVALGHAYWPDVKPAVTADATLPAKMRALAEATIAIIPERRPVAAGRLTGIAHALGSEALQAEVTRATAASYEFGAAWLAATPGDELPMPAEILVRVIHALIEGLTIQRLLTPELVPDAVFYAAFGALAGGRAP